MPVQPTYPGVYIEEIPSGVHTITGVATSITAFVGRAQRGPTDLPVTIYSFSDYQRTYGGLWNLSTMSFAVRDFFLNGGGQAVIARLSNNATAAALQMPTSGANKLFLEASSPGLWGNNLEVAIDYNTKDATDTSLFNITISEIQNKSVVTNEKYYNVSTDKTKGGYLPRVLEQNSNLARVSNDGAGGYKIPAERPLETNTIDPQAPLSPPSNPPGAPPLKAEALTGGTDGDHLTDDSFVSATNSQSAKLGLYMLENIDLFNLLCIPPYNSSDPVNIKLGPNDRPTDVTTNLLAQAVAYCVMRRAMIIIDPLSTWVSAATASKEFSNLTYPAISGNTNRDHAAMFFPRVKQANVVINNEIEEFPPCGMVAGVFANTDAQRGVWKAPAGLEAGLNGITRFSVPLTDMENGSLNQLGVNCLRAFPVYGNVVWGARTVDGADQLASDWKYIPVRRTALFIEESLYRGTKWVVFEPNDEPLWAQIRLNVGAFMHDLFRKGAFQGATPKQAYLVKCDSETTTQNDINSGIVNILVGFAPLKPTEFVIIQIQQLAGQIET
ncbi:MAG: hypothetical protein JWQ57_2908 [Mucilaginibacter sp.]|nr:hypothetical protein [Mucilaginibacter sp.]